ncbi:unnamed protein product [Malus baccata var. baccata]
MASGSSQTQPSYESGEGIATLRRLLNGLHRPRAGLHSELFFETHGVQSLGPAWIFRVPSVVESNMPRDNWFSPTPYSARSGISSSKWSSDRRGFPLMNDPTWAQWIDELEPTFKKKWMSNGIYELIMPSNTSVIPKPELLTSALLFWNSGTNTFDFRMGPMSPTILDMAQVFGLRPSGRIVDVTQDWVSSSTTGSSSSSTSFLSLNYNSATFKSYGTSFKGFIPFVKENFGAGSPRANKDQDHMYFLLYCLNKHIFPNKSKGVRVEWILLVEVLHNFDDVATGPFLLSHLYHFLFEMTRDEPFETNLNGPIWMIQTWLQWYFPEFRAANLEFPEGVAPARILAEAAPIDHSTFACFYFFRVCRTRSDLEWGASVLRRYPWFSDQVFQDAPGEDATPFCREKIISCIQPRDLAWEFGAIDMIEAWKYKWTRKYGGDWKETHDRLFNQLSLKSYPSSGELENWKKMIQEKNRPLLIAPVDIESEAMESEDDSADAAVLHGAAAEAKRRKAGEGWTFQNPLGIQELKRHPRQLLKPPSKRKRP